MAQPTTTGYYWAKWKIAAEGTREGDELTPSNKWEVVEVFKNPLDIEDEEHFGVFVPGVEKEQSIENFFWGPGRLTPPSDTPSKIPICTECKHCRETYVGLYTALGCAVVEMIDPTDGKPVYHKASDYREKAAPCGPEGKLWEAKQ